MILERILFFLLPNNPPLQNLKTSRKNASPGDSIIQASPVDVSMLKSPPSNVVSNKAASEYEEIESVGVISNKKEQNKKSLQKDC